MVKRAFGFSLVVVVLLSLFHPSPLKAQSMIEPTIIWQREVWGTLGSVNAGPGLGIVTDGELVLATGFANGPLHVWERHGAPLLGWGVFAESHGAGYATLNDYVAENQGNEIFVGYYLDNSNPTAGIRLGVFDPYSGQALGITKTVSDGSYLDNPPTGLTWQSGEQAVCLGLHGSGLHCYEAMTMRELLYFDTPASHPEIQTPVVADSDNDGRPELFFIVTTDDFGLVYLYGIDQSGETLPGYPVSWMGGVDAPLVAADLDSNNQLELITTRLESAVSPYDRQLTVMIIQANNGQVMANYPTDTTDPDGGALALADWNGDRLVEIVLQGHQQLAVYNWNGVEFLVKAGWENVTTGWRDWTSPVIGDVDCDGEMEVVTEYRDPSTGYLAVFSELGELKLELPMDLGIVSAPAITTEGGQVYVYTRGVHLPPHDRFFGIDVHKVSLTDATQGCVGIPWSQYQANSSHTGLFANHITFIPLLIR